VGLSSKSNSACVPSQNQLCDSLDRESPAEQAKESEFNMVVDDRWSLAASVTEHKPERSGNRADTIGYTHRVSAVAS
jgi:hypothetical protein